MKNRGLRLIGENWQSPNREKTMVGTQMKWMIWLLVSVHEAFVGGGEVVVGVDELLVHWKVL